MLIPPRKAPFRAVPRERCHGPAWMVGREHHSAVRTRHPRHRRCRGRIRPGHHPASAAEARVGCLQPGPHGRAEARPHLRPGDGLRPKRPLGGGVYFDLVRMFPYVRCLRPVSSGRVGHFPTTPALRGGRFDYSSSVSGSGSGPPRKSSIRCAHSLRSALHSSLPVAASRSRATMSLVVVIYVFALVLLRQSIPCRG